MRRITRHATTAALAAALLLATGCGGDGDDDKADKVKAAGPATITPDSPKPSAPAAPAAPATTAASGTAAAPGAAVAVPKPDPATQAKYVADLDAIDPAIVNGKADRAVSRGRDQCTSIKQWPGDQAKLIGLTDQRFTTPTGPIGAAKAERVLAVVRKHICPDF